MNYKKSSSVGTKFLIYTQKINRAQHQLKNRQSEQTDLNVKF